MDSLQGIDRRKLSIFKTLTKPFAWIGGIVLWTAVLPIYKTYTTFKKLLKRFYAPHISRHKFIHPFSRRYLVHVVIIVIALFTTAANLNANENRREDFGQTSIIGHLNDNVDLGQIEEEGPIIGTKKITKYLGQTGVETKPQATGQIAEESSPSTVAGGSAIVSQILSPIEKELRQRDKIIYHTVQPGDTISEVASQYGITASTILWENNLSAYRIIRPGDTLAILPDSGIRHKVVRGDTVQKIANKYDSDVEKILSANTLTSADDINVGEQLFIPGGVKPAVIPTYSLRTITQVTPVVAPPSAKVVGSGGMNWPSTCKRITQYFRFNHTGIDVACGYGKAIYAADNGTVIKAQGGWNGGYGLVIEIDHGNGITTLYGHNSTLYVKVGETVKKGQTIAAEGSTGRSTGPHNHFEVRVGGVRKNPFYYVN